MKEYLTVLLIVYVMHIPDSLISPSTQINDGIAAARHVDCNAMKTDIFLMLGFYQGSDTLKPDVKENCGYHHALTTAFICPAGVDPNDYELALMHSLVVVNPNIYLLIPDN
jgi:hypothetical protein